MKLVVAGLFWEDCEKLNRLNMTQLLAILLSPCHLSSVIDNLTLDPIRKKKIRFLHEDSL